jgi:hypothetical protein
VEKKLSRNSWLGGQGCCKNFSQLQGAKVLGPKTAKMFLPGTDIKSENRLKSLNSPKIVVESVFEQPTRKVGMDECAQILNDSAA